MLRRDLRELIGVYFLISLGGLLLHVRIHPPTASMFNWVATGFAAMMSSVSRSLKQIGFNARRIQTERFSL